MNKKLVASIFAIWLIACAGYAMELADFGVGSRAIGMGRAGTAFINDASSIFLNPAAICLINKTNFVSALSNSLPDESNVTLGVTLPDVLDGAVGVGYEYLGVSGVPTSDNDFGVHELIVSYARSVSGITQRISSEALSNFSFLNDVYLGGSLKFFSQGYSKDVPDILQGSIGSGMDADLGVKYVPSKSWSLGLLFQDFLPMTLLGKLTLANGKEEGIPSLLKIGGTCRIWGPDSIMGYYDQKLDLAADVDFAPTRTQSPLFHTGLEWWPSEVLALRGGIDQTANGATDTFSNIAMGFGIAAQGFTFDYSFQKFVDGSNTTVNTFSIGYIGAPEPKAPKKVYVETKVVPEVVGVKKIQRKHFKDVPKSYWAVDPIELLATANLLSGFPNMTFKPNKNMTRADFCLMVLNAKNLNMPDSNDKQFNDVAADSVLARQIKAVKDIGAMIGYPDWKFKPFKAITRAESLKVFAIFDNIKPEAEVYGTPFLDVKPNSFVAPYLKGAIENGLVQGHGKFYPGKPISRAEVASMLYKTSFGQAAVKRLPPLID